MDTVSGQFSLLCFAFLLGCMLGLLYDFFRILREYLPYIWLINSVDLLFWLIVTVSLFSFSVSFGNGEVRLLYVFAAAAGALLYFSTAGRLVRRVLRFFSDLISFSGQILTRPLSYLLKKSKKVFKKLKKVFPKIFK